MGFQIFLQQCYHRFKQTFSSENLKRQIQVAWIESSNESLTFEAMIKGFNISSDPFMNFITKGEVAVSRNSLAWFIFLHVNLFFGIGFQIADMWMKISDLDLVDMVNRALFITLLCYMVVYSLLITLNRSYFHYQYMSIKEFNDPCRARFDNNLAQKALRYSMFIFKVCKYLCGVPIFVYFFILPLPRFVISRKLTDLIAMPYQIPYLDGNSIVEVAINITHQLGHGWTCYVYLYFASSYILIVFVYCFIKIQIILDLIKEKQNCETINDDEFQIWHATLIETSRDFTEQLDNHYKSFSWCSFFYIKLCYVTMIVLWLSIKIEPGLRVVGVNFLTFPVFLYLVIALVELVSDKYDELLEAFYDLSWYRWKPAQQKMFIPFIQFLQQPHYLISIHEHITTEWFADFIKKSYSMGCTLSSLN